MTDISVLLYPHKLSGGELADVAASAERAGFRAIWNAEVGCDSTVFNHHVLASTHDILVGTSVTTSWKRHPMQLAETAASMDQLFPGRFAVGVGSAAYSDEPARMWGQPRERAVGRMKEYLDVMRAALTGEQVQYTGEFFEVAGAVYRAPRSSIPIYLSAGGPQMARLAGRRADGVFIHFGSSETLTKLVEQVHEGIERSGRDPGAVRVCQLVNVCVADDRDAAVDGLREHLHWYLSQEYYSKLLGAAGFPEVAQLITERRSANNLEGAMAAISAEVLGTFALPLAMDDPETAVRSRLGSVLAHGVDEVVIYPCPARGEWARSYFEAIKLFARVREGN